MRRGKCSQQLPPPSRQPTARPVAHRGRTPQDSSSAEVFDLGDPNANDSKEESGGRTVLPRSHSPASIEPTVGSESVPTRPASPVLLAPPPVKTSNKAHDVWHFFHKVNGISTICGVCKYVTTFLWTQYLLTRYSRRGCSGSVLAQVLQWFCSSKGFENLRVFSIIGCRFASLPCLSPFAPSPSLISSYLHHFYCLRQQRMSIAKGK